MLVQEELFNKLMKVLPDLEDLVHNAEAIKMKSKGNMDFNVDFLGALKEGHRIALSHYYKHSSGDMIADPDMDVFIDFKSKMLTGLTYQNSMVYQSVNQVDNPH